MWAARAQRWWRGWEATHQCLPPTLIGSVALAPQLFIFSARIRHRFVLACLRMASLSSTAARTTGARPGWSGNSKAPSTRTVAWASAARVQAPTQRAAAASLASVVGSAVPSSSALSGLRASRQQTRSSSVAAASSSDAAAVPAPAAAATPPALAFTTHSYLWRGYKCKYATAGCGPAVLLVHGFGASSRHWRRNIGALADAGYKVRPTRHASAPAWPPTMASLQRSQVE